MMSYCHILYKTFFFLRERQYCPTVITKVSSSHHSYPYHTVSDRTDTRGLTTQSYGEGWGKSNSQKFWAGSLKREAATSSTGAKLSSLRFGSAHKVNSRNVLCYLKVMLKRTKKNGTLVLRSRATAVSKVPILPTPVAMEDTLYTQVRQYTTVGLVKSDATVQHLTQGCCSS